MDWSNAGTIGTVGSLIVAGGAALVKQGMNVGKLIEKVDDLEECKAKVEQSDFLTSMDHDKIQGDCREGIYRDMEVLRGDVRELEVFVKKSEGNRLEERQEDEKRWRKTEDSLLEITTLIKLNMSSKLRGGPLSTPE